MKDALLTICVPTYNRYMMLNKCLSALSNIQAQNNYFNLVIGDNGSMDKTQDVIAKWKPKFENVTVITHPKNIEFDRNVASLFAEVDTEYCWLLGDCDTISVQNYSKIEQHLKDGYDAVVINTDEGLFDKQKTIYTNITDFLNDQGWHVTKLSACIIKSKMLGSVFIRRYYDSHFVHWGNLMESLCQMESFRVLFDPTIPLAYLVDDGNYRWSQKGVWRQVPFYIWGRCWYQTVQSLPFKIPHELKMKVIKDHERKYHWFSVKNLIKNKIKFGKPYIENYKENRQYVKLATVSSPILSDMVMYLPVEGICKMLIGVKRLFSK
jgi:Glycosyltransferases involved in cell wall biogenesis